MRLLSVLLAIVTLVSISGTTFGGENNKGPNDPDSSSARLDLNKSSLAVLVSSQPEKKKLAEDLEALLEAEMSVQWPGNLVERAKLDKILKELKMSSSGLIDNEDQLRISEMLHFDCLLSVKVEADSVVTTVSLFPSTKLICEKTYTKRLKAPSLAVKIVADSIRAIREYNRNPGVPQLSIGSFYIVDPHLQYLKFSKKIGEQLREKLVGNKEVILTERLLPSDLLKEFDLVRGGITKYIARNLSAPPSDILLYGEYKLTPEQDLKSPDVEFEFELFAVSPTGLCKDRSVKFLCNRNNPQAVTQRALELIEKAANEVSQKLASGQKRSFSEKEFQEFKKQAFRLMPNPPLDEGVFFRRGSYRGCSQYGIPDELERAFRMLECAMLFKGDDTQVLVCAATVLKAMTKPYRNVFKGSESTKANLLNASWDIIERAYNLDSNWNTRGFYYGFGLSRSRSPSQKLEVAQHIWNDRHSQLWHPHQIKLVFSTLLASEKDYEKKCETFLEAFSEYDKDAKGARFLFTLPNVFKETNGIAQTIAQKKDLAQRLLNEGSDCAKAVGHLRYLAIYSDIKNVENKNEYAKKYEKQLLVCVDLIPKFSDRYGKRFTMASCAFHEYLRQYPQIQKKYSLKSDPFDLMEKYISAQMKRGNYNAFDASMLDQLIPSMWDRGRYEQGYKLISQFLENYKVGGGGDYKRMKYSRQLRLFESKIDSKTTRGLDQLKKINYSGKNSDWVTKVVLSNGNIFGICCSSYQYRNGRVFRLIPGRKQADIFDEISGNVRDIACTDNFVGAVTQKKGLYLIKQNDLKVSQFTPENSSLPNVWVRLICESGNEFFIASPDKENYYTHVYRLDPEKMKISQTDTKFVTHMYWRLKANTLKSEKSVVIPQTWHHRTFVTADETLEFSCDRQNRAVKDVVVKNDKRGQLLSYKGYELSYVYDFVSWNGVLVFATGNGLYASVPGTNELQGLISDPDMSFFSLCPYKDGMYIGTSKGLYWLDQKTFKGAIKDGTPKEHMAK